MHSEIPEVGDQPITRSLHLLNIRCYISCAIEKESKILIKNHVMCNVMTHLRVSETLT